MSNAKNNLFEFSFPCPFCKTVLVTELNNIGVNASCPVCGKEVPIQPEGRCFEDLNFKQKRAVAAVGGIIRVVAGAGTGKTKVLIHRLAHLILDIGIPGRRRNHGKVRYPSLVVLLFELLFAVSDEVCLPLRRTRPG